MQGVLARFVGEIGNPFSVRRPCRIAFHHTGSVGHIPWITLVRRHGEDLAAGLEHRTNARRRNGRVSDAPADLFVPRTDAGEVSTGSYLDLSRTGRSDVHDVDRAELL